MKIIALLLCLVGTRLIAAESRRPNVIFIVADDLGYGEPGCYGDWKLIPDGGAWQLFDLAADIAETTNLAAKQPARVVELSALWDKWNAEQIDPLWK